MLSYLPDQINWVINIYMWWDNVAPLGPLLYTRDWKAHDHCILRSHWWKNTIVVSKNLSIVTICCDLVIAIHGEKNAYMNHLVVNWRILVTNCPKVTAKNLRLTTNMIYAISCHESQRMVVMDKFSSTERPRPSFHTRRWRPTGPKKLSWVKVHMDFYMADY